MNRIPPATPTPGLRRRVGLAVLGVVALVLTVLFVFVDVTLSARLHAGLQARLLDRAGFAQLLDGRVSPQQLVDQLTGDGVSARLMTNTGPVMGVQPPGPLGPRPGGKGPKPPSPTDATISSSGDLLTVTTSLREGRLVLSVSQADVAATVQRLVVLEVFGGLAALTVLAAALHGTVGLALRPLGR